MYKGVNYREHNRQQLQKSQQFLQSKNVSIPASTATINQQSQSDSEDVLWQEIQKIQALAAQQNNHQNISNNRLAGNIDNQRNESNANQQRNQPTHRINSNANYRNNITNLEQFNSEIPQSSFNNYMKKSFTANKTSFQQLSQQSQRNQYDQIYIKPKPQQKNKKEKKKGKQTQQQNYPAENIILQKKENQFTIDMLRINQPLTRNYRIANQQQWENNRKIEDYKLTFVLRNFPKIKSYRNNQKAIIKCSLLGNDVFVCMPTGGGKSLTFQAMTFIEKGVYLCILPLVSLIIDQQQQAKKVGIKAYSLTGSKQIQDNKMIYQQLASYGPGDDSIVVFCTPEKVNKSPQFLNVLHQIYQKKLLVKIVIDQVHCVSTWGKQFRQEYQNLSSLRQNFPNTPILGLTATVTQVIKQDIIKRLGIKNCYYFQSSFNRPNLYYEVKQKTKDVLNLIIQVINQFENQSGIIYCISRKQCQQMSQMLRSKRYKVAFYHANISQNQKRQIQTKWMNNQIQIIIATIAFGMGINKPDVRFVIHHSLSKSLQNYYQQSGRAGRDGQNAKCILFYRKADKISLQSLIMKNQISKDQNKNFCMRQLSNIIQYCQDKYTCRRKFQLEYLGEKDFHPQDCNKTCDNCKRGWKYYEVQCIKQAKYLVQFVLATDRIKQNISQNQIIMLCKGNSDKKFKYKIEQIQRSLNLQELKEMFAKWNKKYIDQLITCLLGHEVFFQKIVTTNTYKNNMVSNFYIKVNNVLARKFLDKVQTLPMKRSNFQRKSNGKQTNMIQISDLQFDFGQEELTMQQHQNGNFETYGFQEDKYSFQGSKKVIRQFQ